MGSQPVMPEFGPSPLQRNSRGTQNSKRIQKIAQGHDVAERDERNRLPGRAGEEIVLAHECRALAESGRMDLASQAGWVSGEGYDISSYGYDGRTWLIEVRTTNDREWTLSAFPELSSRRRRN